MVYGKQIKPGFFAIGTTNPPGIRYPNHHRPEVALQEEFSEIKLDYLPNTVDDPEGYEFIVVELMDKNGLIGINLAELSPAYSSEQISKPDDFPAEDDRHNYQYTREKIVDDPTDSRHGYLYRLSFGVRAIQDCFNLGNEEEIPDSALRDDSGEPIRLNATINAGEVAQWCRQYKDRFGLDNPSFHTENVSDFFRVKLENFIRQVSDKDDQEKIRSIIDSFHLLDGFRINDSNDNSPPTPKEIGYLSPRVPRPVIVRKIEKTSGMPKKDSEPTETPDIIIKPEDHKTVEITLEDGSRVKIYRQPLDLSKLPTP